MRSEFLEKFDLIEGEGDVKAIAEGAEKYPFRFLKREAENATVVESPERGNEIARYHLPLSNISTLADARTMLGTFGSEVTILKIEGLENDKL